MSENNETQNMEAAAIDERAGVNEQAEQEEKKYTDSDVDRIVSKKLKRERERVRKTLTESEQLSEIEIRERNVLKREMMADAREQLKSEGLPDGLAELMNYESKETFEESYELTKNVFNEAIKAYLIEKARGATPKAFSSPSGANDSIAAAFSPTVR